MIGKILKKRKMAQGRNRAYLILAGFLILVMSSLMFGGCSTIAGNDSAAYKAGGVSGNLRRIFSGSGGGCCNNSSVSEESEKSSIAAKAEDYIRQKYNIDDFEVNVADYGCHVQYDIYQNGKIFKSLIYANGDFLEIS
jgi:uncharacterized protein YceK